MGTVFIVDDDASVRRALSRLIRQAGYEERTFASAEEFLDARPVTSDVPSCLILDLHMPGLSGLDLQSQLHGPSSCPIVFVSGNGDIPASVQAMRQGALTFLPKPFDDAELLTAVAEGIAKHRAALAIDSQRRCLNDRIAALTDREREVMAWVITGALNKQTAGVLGIAEQTVKLHRSRVMEKIGVVSVAELVRLCDAAGFKAAAGSQ